VHGEKGDSCTGIAILEESGKAGAVAEPTGEMRFRVELAATRLPPGEMIPLRNCKRHRGFGEKAGGEGRSSSWLAAVSTTTEKNST
jgi:hypothetical protein